jgi:hypothetical protein
MPCAWDNDSKAVVVAPAVGVKVETSINDFQYLEIDATRVRQKGGGIRDDRMSPVMVATLEHNGLIWLYIGGKGYILGSEN